MDRIGDLEINENLGFQEREWKIERVGWVALLLLVAVAALGLFGHGPISWTSTSTDDGSLKVSFERFGRNGGTQDLVIHVDADAAESGMWQVEVSRDYLASLNVDSIVPQPESVESVDGALLYTFSQAELDADLDVTFGITPDGLWGGSGEIGLTDGPSVEVSHFFFP